MQQASIFDDRDINLVDTVLTIYDVQCITFFLLTPQAVEETCCHIQDHSLNGLHTVIMGTGTLLSGCNLTQSSSAPISDLIIHCRMEDLWINSNHAIGEDPTLYNILFHPYLMLMTLLIKA